MSQTYRESSSRKCQLRRDLEVCHQQRLVHDQTDGVGQSDQFETELVKKVLGQPADLSRHSAVDRLLAHEICFNIVDKMLPYLLGADLSSGCMILRVSHREVFASTAEHTAALHERFAKLVPCRDKTKHSGSQTSRSCRWREARHPKKQ